MLHPTDRLLTLLPAAHRRPLGWLAIVLTTLSLGCQGLDLIG